MKVFRNIPKFEDYRGVISRLLPDDVLIRDVFVITSKKGSERAGHYHKKDSHYCYLIKGSMLYMERGLEKGAKTKAIFMKEGAMVYTPPKHKHWMRFSSDSIFVAMATRPRNQKDYEKDTVRI